MIYLIKWELTVATRMPPFSVQSNVARMLLTKQSLYLKKFLKVSCFGTTYRKAMLIFLIAKFTVDVQGYTAEDDDMLCLKLRVDFMKPFPRLW
jgi:hypothetical protein